jgi:PDZ domain-containing protein
LPTAEAQPELATAKDEHVTTESGVPPPPSAEAPPPTRRRRPLLAAGTILGLVVVIALVAGAVIRLPYVLIAPGNANVVQRVVKVHGAPTYAHRGDLLFLTVSVSSDRPNVFAVLSGWLDDNTDVEPEDKVLQGRSRVEDARLNRLEMADSQMTAKRVALERLGYTVPVSGQGAVVTAVEKGAPAAGKLRVGDVITAVDGEPVTLSDQLGPIVRSRAAGQPVTLTVQRDHTTSDVTIVTRAAPAGQCQGRAQVGVSTATRGEKFDFPVDVSIDPGKVSGPSAGLAFTLTILDELTPGDLTGGKQVAVTGTIEPDGSVGPIGGAAQKAVTARRAGAKLFLVPTAEVKEARSRADGMRVVGVGTLDDALHELQRFGGDETGVPPAPPSSPQC